MEGHVQTADGINVGNFWNIDFLAEIQISSQISSHVTVVLASYAFSSEYDLYWLKYVI